MTVRTDYSLNGELVEKRAGGLVTPFNPDSLGRLKSVNLPDASFTIYALDLTGRRSQKAVNGTAVTRSIFEDELKLAAEINLQTQGKKEYVFATSINPYRIAFCFF